MKSVTYRVASMYPLPFLPLTTEFTALSIFRATVFRYGWLSAYTPSVTFSHSKAAAFVNLQKPLLII
jgi:hypothetical protein